MSTYDIKVFSIAGEVYHEVSGLSGKTTVGEILSEVKSEPRTGTKAAPQVLANHAWVACSHKLIDFFCVFGITWVYHASTKP